MKSDETASDLPEVVTSQLPVLRDAHLEEAEFLDLSRQLLEPEAHEAALRHLDVCLRCRERLSELHLDDDGHGSTRLSDPLLGHTLGEYKVEAALSRGGMGVVYRGVHPVIGKQVAIKVLLPDTAQGPDQIDRLLQEARAVNAIRHPNIIDIFSFGDLPGGRHYFVMELLDGLPLDALQQEKGRLSPLEVITVLEQSMSALGAAHAAGVIHRDLKPANLFVSTLPDGSWHLTVLDFGLAKRLGAGVSTSPNLVMGTPGFMSPEQIRGQVVTAATDLYAMGVVAWVLLTGAEPFNADSFVELMMQHVQAPLPPLGPLVPGCPPALVALVEKLLAKQASARPASAMAVLAELQRIERELLSAQRVPRAPAPVMVPLDQVQKPNARRAAYTAPPAPPELEKTALRPPEKPRKHGEVTARLPPRPPALTDVNAALPAPATDRTPVLAGLGVVALILVSVGGWVLWPRPPVELPLELDEPAKVAEPVPVAEPVAVPEPVPVAEPVLEPVKGPEPVRTPRGVKPTASGPTPASVEKRLAQARTTAAKLPSAAARRMMNLDLDRIEARLKAGDAPRALTRDLEEVVQNYGAP